MLTVREAAALPHTPEIRRYSHVGRLYLRDRLVDRKSVV